MPCTNLPTLSAQSPARRGFTLIELLTVIAIIGILMGILVPTMHSVQTKARMMKSTANLSGIGKALLNYTIDNHGLLPAPEYGASSSSSNAQGSANPRGGTWMEELIGPKYLGGGYDTDPGSRTITVTEWPPVFTDPEYVSKYGAITDPHIRGYGMNAALYRIDKNNPNHGNTYPTQRQSLQNLPNLSKNMVIGTSNDVMMVPNLDTGQFEKDGANYKDGDPARFGNQGLFLFLDGSVEAMTPDEVANLFNPQS